MYLLYSENADSYQHQHIYSFIYSYNAAKVVSKLLCLNTKKEKKKILLKGYFFQDIYSVLYPALGAIKSNVVFSSSPSFKIQFKFILSILLQF